MMKRKARDHYFDLTGDFFSDKEIDSTLMVLNSVRSAMADNDDKIDPDWSWDFAEMARILLSERNRIEMINMKLWES